MKKIILFIIFQSGFLFAQKNNIDKQTIIPGNIDFNGSVNKITLKTFDLNKKEDKIDTVKTISEIHFSKQKKILKINRYDKSLNDLWSITEFDNLERVIKISRKIDGKMLNTVIQYFSNQTEYPDSTLIYSSASYKEIYKNYFKNDLVIKQEHFVNGELEDNRLYKYNDKNQLIEDLYVNPENNSDETVVFKSSNQLSFYPEKLVRYEYKESKDTLISIKIRPKYNSKEITKKLKTKKFSLEIIEDYDNDFFKNSRIIYTYKDSINYSSYYYKNKKQIRDYYITITTNKNIISKWKTEGYGNNEEKTETLQINVTYDKFKNWIRKIYSKGDQTTKIIEREIEYY
jgi:hypothetical protein